MKTRMVVHIALNAKNERVCILVDTCGRLIPHYGDALVTDLRRWKKLRASVWIKGDLETNASLKEWKLYCKQSEKAVRFQRVTLLGETR